LVTNKQKCYSTENFLLFGTKRGLYLIDMMLHRHVQGAADVTVLYTIVAQQMWSHKSRQDILQNHWQVWEHQSTYRFKSCAHLHSFSGIGVVIFLFTEDFFFMSDQTSGRSTVLPVLQILPVGCLFIALHAYILC